MTEKEIYWKAEDHLGRLSEMLGGDPDLAAQPLRRDVRSLGMLLGKVIREQAGQEGKVGSEGKWGQRESGVEGKWGQDCNFATSSIQLAILQSLPHRNLAASRC